MVCRFAVDTVVGHSSLFGVGPLGYTCVSYVLNSAALTDPEKSPSDEVYDSSTLQDASLEANPVGGNHQSLFFLILRVLTSTPRFIRNCRPTLVNIIEHFVTGRRRS